MFIDRDGKRCLRAKLNKNFLSGLTLNTVLEFPRNPPIRPLLARKPKNKHNSVVSGPGKIWKQP